MKQLVEVMAENPDEIVILHIEKTIFNDSSIVERKFDNMVQGYFNNVCIKSNISDNAGSLKMSDIWKNNDRLIVLYPRKTDKFWMAKKSIQAKDLGLKINYKTFKNNIKSVYNNELLKVVIASRSFKYSEFLDVFINLNDVDQNLQFKIFKELYEIRNEKFDNNKLFTNNNLTSKILSMTFVDTESSTEMIKYNEKVEISK